MIRRLVPVLLLAACVEQDRFDCFAPGAVCTIAGTGAHGFNGDGLKATRTWLYFPTAVRFDRDDNPLIVDFNNLRVRTIDADGVVQTLAGSGFHAYAKHNSVATQSPLENPIDAWPTPAGGFIAAELHAGRLLHVGADGILTVIAGNGNLGFSGDGGPATQASMSEASGIAIAEDGTVYIADTENHSIRVVDPIERTIDSIAGNGRPGGADGPVAQATFHEPQKLEWHEGAVYVADRWNHRIRRIDVQSGLVETVVGTGSPGWSGDGGPAVDAQLFSPWGLDIDDDGVMWIADSENHVIRRVAPDGTIDTVVGVGEPGEGADTGRAGNVALNLPNHVQMGPDGRLWIADTLNSRIRAWTP